MRHLRTALSLSLVAAVFAACSDGPSPTASEDTPPIALAVSDGSTGGNDGFYFLPPLGRDNSPDEGFNPDLAPRIEICQLESEATGCGVDPVNVAEFGPDDITVDPDDELYQVNWKTRGRGTAPLDPDKFYRIRVFLGDTELGFLDLDPRSRGRPSRQEGFFDFRINRTIPIKFWLGAGALCDSEDPTVIECQEFTIVDDEDFSAFIDEEGDRIGVEVPAGSLPDGIEFLNITIERLDLPVGECVENVDTPLFGPCGRITTTPVLDQPLNLGATVAICIDTGSPEFALVTGGQIDLLQIYRQTEDGAETQILTNADEGICDTTPPVVGSEVGPIAVAMDRIIRSVEGLFAPRPLYAADLGLGGLTRRFSRFQWSLPCEIVVVDGVDDQTAAPGAPVANPPAAVCEAANGQPVNGARIRFEVDEGDGTLVPPVGGFDDGNGVLTAVVGDGEGGVVPVPAAVGDWILGDPGANSVRLFGTGLLGDGDDFFFHQGDFQDPEAETQEIIPVGEVLVTATGVVDETPAVDELVIIDDGVGIGDFQTLFYSGFASFDLTVQALAFFGDEIGSPVSGAQVSWSSTGDGGAFSPDGGSTTTSVTDEGGLTTVTFTAIGAPHTVTATVDGEIVATFDIVSTETALELGIPQPETDVLLEVDTVLYRTGAVELVVEARGADIEGEPNPLDGIPVSWVIVSQNGDGPITTGSFTPNGIVTEAETVTGESEVFGFGRTGVFFYPSSDDDFEVWATAEDGELLARFLLAFEAPAEE